MTLPVQPEHAARRLRLCALASGSKGNCIYVGYGDTHILIDCGVAQRDISAGLKRVSASSTACVDFPMLSGILISHEHSDHIKSCAALARRYDIPVYASAQTLRAINAKSSQRPIPERDMCAITPGQDFYIGDINITPFKTPHDAVCSVGYRIDVGAASVAVATDIGYITDSWMRVIEGTQLVLLEANHDRDMLINGDYPDVLKKRILSDRGHLSNDACARAAAHLARTGTRVILLSHLSENNNTPRLAYDTVANELRAEGIRPGKEIYLGLLEQNHASDIFELDCE